MKVKYHHSFAECDMCRSRSKKKGGGVKTSTCMVTGSIRNILLNTSPRQNDSLILFEVDVILQTGLGGC